MKCLKNIFCFLLLIVIPLHLVFADEARKSGFLWGVASSAYQTEGGAYSGGKGLSNWDYLTGLGITKYYNGEIRNGDIAADGFNKINVDVELLRKLGVNSYRFSVAWTRVLPDGININDAGLDYYRELVRLLVLNEIRPLITIYHWDMPILLYKQGGAKNKKFIDQYRRYANVLFDNFGDVADFVTFNEPVGEIFELNPMTEAFSRNDTKAANAVFNSERIKVDQAPAAHNVLLANALVIKDFHDKKLDGKIGITFNISPQVPFNEDSTKDVEASELNSEIRNQWFLDPMYFGYYPKKAEKIFIKLGWKRPSKEDMKFIYDNPPDFIGVNFYSPTFVFYEKSKPFGIGVKENTDKIKAYNGQVVPSSLYDALLWLDKRYSHPAIIVTEVGAGFGDVDDSLSFDIVDDKLRSKFITDHANYALLAKANGVNLKGFFVWSLIDNFEWMCAYKCRYGLVYVDYDSPSLRRVPKSSYYKYRELIRGSSY
jgi:beta-glucosidase